MKAKEIKVGGLYRAKVSNKLVTVRVDMIEAGYDGRTRYHVTNLTTKRTTTFRSAMKFRCEARSDKPSVTLDQLRARQRTEAELASPGHKAALEGAGYKEGEQGSDPTASTAPVNPDTTPPVSTASAAAPAAVGCDTAPPQSSPASEPAPSADSFEAEVVCVHCDGSGEQGDGLCNECNGEGTVKVEADPMSARSVEDGQATASASAHEEGEQRVPFEQCTASGAAPSATESPAPSAVATPRAVAPSAASSTATAPAPTTAPTSLLAAKLAGLRIAEVVSRDVNGKVAGMVPTEEQASILEVAKEPGLKVLVIGAGAGTGKTATLKMLEQTLRGIGQYTAFNSSLVAESKAKFVKASCNTTHSLAFRAVGKLYSHRLGGPRVRSDQVARALGLGAFQVEYPDPDSDGQMKRRTLQAGYLAGQLMIAIRKFCQSADRHVEDKHFRYIDGIDQPTDGKRSYTNNRKVQEYLLPYAEKAWADLSDPQGTLPFSHDVYVKVWQLGEGNDRPVIGADYILLDEAQDTAPVFLDVLKQQKHALLVLVGDDNQQIYEWRGACNAMAEFKGAPRRLLSQSFRFGQIIADVANSILKTLEVPTDLVMKGLPSIPSRVGEVKEPRCILCRTNAAAVSAVLQAKADGKRPFLIGGGAEVVAFVKAARDLQVPRPTSHPELCCFESWKEVQEYVKLDEGEDLKLLVKLVDEFGADAIIEALEHMPAEKDADLVVSTAHKSKGREWDTVRLAGDFPLITKMSDSDRRLLYVACTRAKLVLDVSRCPTFIGGTDRGETGNPERAGVQVPGLEVRYTVPMPSQQDVDAYLAARVSERAAVKPTSTQAPQVDPALVSSTEAKGNGTTRPPNGGRKPATEFNWSKYNSCWVVRGPAEQKVGARVTVTRKNGTSSIETVREIVARYPEAWLYRV